MHDSNFAIVGFAHRGNSKRSRLAGAKNCAKYDLHNRAAIEHGQHKDANCHHPPRHLYLHRWARTPIQYPMQVTGKLKEKLHLC